MHEVAKISYSLFQFSIKALACFVATLDFEELALGVVFAAAALHLLPAVVAAVEGTKWPEVFAWSKDGCCAEDWTKIALSEKKRKLSFEKTKEVVSTNKLKPSREKRITFCPSHF